MTYETLIVETRGAVGLVTLNRPKALNALNPPTVAGVDLNVDAGCRYEAEAFAVAFATADRVERMRAFLEKRPAVFKGR